MNYCFGDYELHADSHELLCKGCLQKTEPLVFKLLIFMLENPDRVLSRDELISEVWKSSVVSDSALSATICAVRHAIGDTGSKQDCIKTVSGSGYRFIAEFTSNKNNTNSANTSVLPQLTYQSVGGVHLAEAKGVSNLPVTPLEKMTVPLELPDKPSVAVMDFIDMGSSQESALFAYGLTTEINSSLSRLSHLFVIARASSAYVSKLDLLPQEISKQLGVRYLVYGNTQRLSNRIRVTMSIVDAINNNEIWSEHFDRSLDDIFLLQDEITTAIVMAVDAAIEQVETERAFLIPTENLTAWENYHQALWHNSQTTVNDVKIARHLFEQALSQDSRFSRAYAGLSFSYSSCWLLDVASEDDKKKAYDYAQCSLDYDRRETMGYVALARGMWLSNEHRHALDTCDQGLGLDPNSVHCCTLKGVVAAHAGEDVVAHDLTNSIHRMSPLDPKLFSVWASKALSLAHQQKYKEAVYWVSLAANHPNAYFAVYASATAIMEMAGHSTQARHYATQTLEQKPDYSIESYERLVPHADLSMKGLMTHAMLKAGIPRRSAVNG